MEVGYVLSRLRDPEVSIRARLWTAIEFFLLFLDPRIRADLLWPGDRLLYYRAIGRFLRSFFGKRSLTPRSTEPSGRGTGSGSAA
jgi:hypothetical protein